jgi:hypothetical protein
VGDRGALIKGLTSDRGMFTVDTLKRPSSNVAIFADAASGQWSNRHRGGGGAGVSRRCMRSQLQRTTHGLSTHMDGAV